MTRPFLRNPSIPRAIEPGDRKKINAELNLRCDAGSYPALRLRVCVQLSACSGLRLCELVALDTVQLVETIGNHGARFSVVTQAYVRRDQAKGAERGSSPWTSAGVFLVSDDTRSAIRAYLDHCRGHGWVDWPPKPGDPLLLAVRSNRNATRCHGKNRASKRVIQHDFADLQVRAGIREPYHFHCLRHDAMTRCSEETGGNAKKIAEFGRCDVVTAMKYIHLRREEMAQLRNQLSFGRR